MLLDKHAMPEGRIGVLPGERLHYLDALRGIAALSVVCFHSALDVLLQPSVQGIEHNLLWFICYVVDLGKCGVVLFFVISGFVIPSSLKKGERAVSKFLVSRFFRLYPLYWVTLVITLILAWPSDHFPIPLVLANLTMFQRFIGFEDVMGVAWTLQIELAFYGACVLLSWCGQLQQTRTLTFACLCCLLGALLMALVRYEFARKLPVAMLLGLSLMFFGSVLRRSMTERDASARKASRLLLTCIILLLPVVCVLSYSRDYGHHETWYRYLLTYYLAIGVFLLGSTQLRGKWRALVFCGEISYSIYLLHPLVGMTLDYFGVNGGLLPQMDPILWILLIVILTVMCSFVTFHIVERPFIELGRRIRLGLRVAPGVALPQVGNQTQS